MVVMPRSWGCGWKGLAASGLAEKPQDTGLGLEGREDRRKPEASGS